ARHQPLLSGAGAEFSADPAQWTAWQRTLGRPPRERLDGLEAVTPGVLVDFGRCLNGRVRLDGDPDAPAVAIVSLGESAAEALHGPDIPLQTLCLPAGGCAETCESGFRFARIHFLPLPGHRTVRPQGIRAQYIFTPMTYRGTFRSPDETLNAIWNLGAYTVRQNIQDEVWDANKRDRHPFTGDLVPQEAVARVVFDDPKVIRHTLSFLAAEAGLPGSARRHINGISTYSALWVEVLYRDFRQTGDLAYVRAQKPAMLGLLARLEQDLDASGAFRNALGGWPFVDWSPGLWHRPAIAPITEAQCATAHAMMYGAVTAAAEMLAALGAPADLREADRLAALGRRMKEAAFAEFWQPDTESFGLRKHPNAAAVYFGLTDEAQSRRIEEDVLSQPFRGEAFPDSLHRDRPAPDRMSPYFVFYLLEARARAGKPAEALDFLRSYWGEMLRRGATTTWELFQPSDQPGPDIPGYGPDWDVETPGASCGMSLMHGWSAGATYWLSRHVLGVRETSPGYATAEIRPTLGPLAWAEGTVPTPRGDITVRHEQSAGEFQTTVNVPQRVDVRAGIPKAPGSWTFSCGTLRTTPVAEDAGWWLFAIPSNAETIVRAARVA
ncbi:MAG TPA: alpha-L-rhamnosidase C-terminal domain-containing protein, partial [Terrimicrobiaceae bacterium]|nr:alpha-L-rhamnosidase C-terminal domain-containing protein [Terrimicrobiaceae bacterium]